MSIPSSALKHVIYHTLSGLELLRLTRPSNPTREPPEGNNLFVLLHVSEVCVGLS